MDTVSQWQIIVGTGAPIAISFIQQEHWTTQFKTFVAFACLLAISYVTASLDGSLATLGLFPAFVKIFSASIISFKSFWQPSGIAQAIESATTIKPQPEN